MEFNSGVSMFLPDSIGLNENDFDEEDHEDIVHEQTNQNEVCVIHIFYDEDFIFFLFKRSSN
jgi:hypothetical protein